MKVYVVTLWYPKTNSLIIDGVFGSKEDAQAKAKTLAKQDGSVMVGIQTHCIN